MKSFITGINELKNELQNIIYGPDACSESQLIKAAQTYLGESFKTGKGVKEKKYSREQEEEKLKEFINQNSLWVLPDSFGTFITEGAEQKVYFPENSKDVIKINDAVFYLYWEDYFNNLLIHNFLFPDTAYSLIGFHRFGNKLFAVLRQPFIESTNLTNLDYVKQFLLANGFEIKKDNDYFHPFLGIILEDLHDENVLTNNENLFFVDTVFYLTDNFYK